MAWTRGIGGPLTLAVILSGCVGLEGAPLPVQPSAEFAESARVVVAVLDTGIQPYHEVFALPPEADTGWIRALPGIEVVPSSFAEHALDREAWNLTRDQLYWFEGTRVLAVSTVREADESVFGADPTVVFDDRGHGTMTSSVVAQASPHSFIVMVEMSSYNGTIEWVRDQPWIDLVSMSVGQPPLPFTLVNNVDRSAYTPPWVLRDMVTAGRLVFLATGNDPSPTLHSEEGMPWIVAVGGANLGNHGAAPLSRGPPDLVANYTHPHLARRANLTDYASVSGTSFSAPMVAGVAAEALWEARSSLGHRGGIADGALVRAGDVVRTNADLRAALNASTELWATGDYVPPPAPGLPFPDIGTLTVPVVPEAQGTMVGPWVQMGWGWLGESSIPMVVQVLVGEVQAPAKPAGAEAYMAEAYGLREAYWGLPVHG